MKPNSEQDELAAIDRAEKEYYDNRFYEGWVCADFRAGMLKGIAYEREKTKELVEALETMINEAELNLSMYVKIYKREPCDSGSALIIYIKETELRIEAAKKKLAKYRGVK